MVILKHGTDCGKECRMKRKIEKGITILDTTAERIGVRNKLGCAGISQYCGDKWRTEISIGKKKYLVGVFDDFQDAIKARKLAEQKKQAGTLVEWIASRPHGNALNRKKFWDEQFEGMNQ